MNRPSDQALLDIVQQMTQELHPGTAVTPLALDSALERDLGFDSLARVELIARIEQVFDVSLPERLLGTAETVRDLLFAVQHASGTHAVPSAPATRLPSSDTVVATSAPSAITDLVAVLDWHVQAHPGRAHIHLMDESGREEVLSYADLQRGADAVLAGLYEYNLQPGGSVAIMLPTGREYFCSFFGVLRAGGIPVPIYPPARASQIEEHLRRHARILANAQVTILITVQEARSVAQLLRLHVESLRSVVTVDDLHEAGTGAPAAPLPTREIALLQYTSGSTGNPKGVMLTHANLLANIRGMGEAVRADSTDTFVSWMPLYHDMGLIGAWLGSLYYAIPLVVMSPFTFLRHPERWLWAIHRHRATISGGPNFGYELCLRRIRDSDIEGLDLSSWRLALNGAEPVSPDTITRFSERFAPCGFRPEILAPVYGLAESSVGLAFPPLGRPPVIDRVRREMLVSEGRAVPAAADDPHALRFVSCGYPLAGHEIRIVDETGHEAGEREQGRLEFRGPSCTSGYIRNPEETKRLFHDEWLDSGDLAYMADGEIYITGRLKDVIIHAGRNVYPHELEEAVGDLPGIRKGCVAVFGCADHASATERLVVLAETHESAAARRAEIITSINTRAMELIGVVPDDVVLAPPHTVLKTSSGKVRRAASRALYERGGIGAPTRAFWRQITHLLLEGARPLLRRGLRIAGTVFHAVYAWLIFLLLAPVVWLAVVMSRRPARALGFARRAACLLRYLSRTPLLVSGREHLPAGPYVLVANHASYLDGIVLTAALPGVFSFVAKRELTGRLIARLFLQRIGVEFVERFDPQRGVTDTRRLAEAVHGGRALVFFPEGTFDRRPGLRPFHMGAFVTAVEAGVPVVACTIRGTRSILRPNEWFPRRGVIGVAFGEPFPADGKDWAAAVRLRDRARTEILRGCGEPDLAANRHSILFP